MNCLCLYSFCVLSACVPMAVNAADNAKTAKPSEEETATLSVQEHYGAMIKAYEEKKWEELAQQSAIITKNFPTSPFAQEAVFYLGVGYFYLKDYEFANKQFAIYLKRQSSLKHFEEAIQYKFAIAEKYKSGAKKHLMGMESMPKWIPAQEDAIAIYNEVITALPHHDLGAQALYSKAKLLFNVEDYKSSIEAYQTLIRRFPKHSLAIEGYVGIGEIYLAQCQAEFPDPDFLDLAEMNVRKFRQDFPREEKVRAVDDMLISMQEIYAKSLYETAQFFERTQKPGASLIYYSNVIAKYPNTKVAELSQKRLQAIDGKKADKVKAAKHE